MDVRAFLRRGRARWPAIALAEAVAADHVADKDDSPHAEDLYLACACAAGDEAALAAFEEHYLSQVHVFLGRMKPTLTLIDDVKQTLRVRLLVAAPVPRIAEYAGRGSLTSWLRVAAIRLAIDLLKETGGAPIEDEPIEQIGGGDPELELIKERYRDEVNGALRDAFSTLSAEHRNLLRLSYRDGLSIDEIGALMGGAHRATAARWIAEARDAVLDEARCRLESRLKLTASELDSLIRLLRSQIHLSVSRLLRSLK